MDYKLVEVDAAFYDKCNHKDIVHLGIAERYGLEAIAIKIIKNEASLSPRLIRNCMVYNGPQVCFAPSANMVGWCDRRQQWLSSVFSVTDNGIMLVWFDPDGENKFYRVEQ